jgi:uncharacterized membrane protein
MLSLVNEGSIPYVFIIVGLNISLEATKQNEAKKFGWSLSHFAYNTPFSGHKL